MFKDREEAGEKLAIKLTQELSKESILNAIVLGIPRGGVVVGGKIKQALKIPFDVLVTKKLPAPENEELAIGAVAEGGTVVWEEELLKNLKVPKDYEAEIVKRKLDELDQKIKDFRGNRELLNVRGKTVILTDDGVATGSTIKAGIAVLRSFSPKEIIVAIPVISADTLPDIKKRAERLIYLESPEMFFSVGQFYENFEPVPDERVKEILKV